MGFCVGPNGLNYRLHAAESNTDEPELPAASGTDDAFRSASTGSKEPAGTVPYAPESAESINVAWDSVWW